MRHKVLTFLGALAIIIIISVIGGGKNGTSTTPQSSNNAPSTTSEKAVSPKTIKYSDGKYLVGKDIKSGLYKVTLKDTIMNMGYVERAKDVNMEMESIIANIILTGNGYVEILSTDVAVKLQGVEFEPITLAALKPAIKKEASDAMSLS